MKRALLFRGRMPHTSGLPQKIVLALIMTTVLLTAASCTKKDKDTAAAAKPQKLTVWCWDPNFNGYSMQKAADVYEAMHPEVTIDIVDIPDNIEGKIEAGLQAGGAGLPDIALFQDFFIEKFIQNYPGSFADLQAEGIDYSQFAQYKVAPMTDGSSVYGIPFDTGSTGLFLRADLIQEAGLNPEDYMKNMTWSEVISLGVAIKEATGMPLISYDNTSYDFLRIMVQSTGTQFFHEDGSVNYNTPATVKALEYLKEMNEKGLLYMTEGWNNWIAAFNGGETVGLMNALWIIGTLKSNQDYAGKWMVVPTPLVEGISGAQNASNNGGSSWYVFSSSKQKDLAVDFLKNTWAGTSPEALGFYNEILKGAGAMGTFLPSRTGSNYTADDEFFYMNQPVYKDFSTWMEKVPVLYYTPNYNAMRTSLNNSMQLMFSGDINNIEDVLSAAEAEYRQVTGN